jgi:hypothetical protein
MIPGLILFLFCIQSPHAATCTWTNGTGNNLWSTGGNWSCGAAPGSADAVQFNGTSTANCYFDSYATAVASLTFTSAYTGRFEWGYSQFGKGIRGQYFGDNAYTGGTYSRVDAQVNFPSDWSASTPSGIGSTTYRVIWHGWVLPQ